MLDLYNLPTNATMRIVKCVPKNEGGSLAWDIELSMEVQTEKMASTIDQYVPGTLAVYLMRESNKGEAKTSGGFDLARVSFKDAAGGNLAKGHCEIRGAAVRVSSSQSILLLKIRVHGLVPKAAMSIVYMLDEHVELVLEENTISTELPPTPAPQNLNGKLIVHKGAQGIIAGIVCKQDGKTLHVSVMEKEEPVTIVLNGAPDTVLQVCMPNGNSNLRDALVAYVKKCDDVRAVATWHDVVAALGALYAKNEAIATPDMAWELTGKVWEDAFSLATKNSLVN